MITADCSVNVGALYEAGELDHRDGVEGAERRARRPEQVDGGTSGQGVCGVGVHVLTDPAGHHRAVMFAEVTGEEQQVARAPSRDIVGDGDGGLRDDDVQLGETVVDAHGQ